MTISLRVLIRKRAARSHLLRRRPVNKDCKKIDTERDTKDSGGCGPTECGPTACGDSDAVAKHPPYETYPKKRGKPRKLFKATPDF